MKISRTAWLILGIGIFAIAIGILCWVFLQQVQEQKGLNNSLSLAQATLPRVISERNDLESQLPQLESELAQAESLLSGVKARFPESVESIEYDEVLFEIADDCDLEIIELTASEPSDEEIAGITYYITSFKVKVEGKYGGYIDKTVGDILDFINTIATSEYSPGETNFVNAIIKEVNMEVPEPGEVDEKPKATIKLDIYGYQGE